MEEIAVSHDTEEYANVEQLRTRQSECVNLKALELEQKLFSWEIALTTVSNKKDYFSNTNANVLLNSSNTSGNLLMMPVSSKCEELQHHLQSLPSWFIEALEAFMTCQEEVINKNNMEISALELQCAQCEERLTELTEKTSKVKDSVAFLSEKSSAELHEFRSHLTQCANWAKERNHELATLNRQQEKTEFEIRRAEIELDRLRNLAKRVK